MYATGAGRSAGSPSGAPLSTYIAIFRISSSDSEGSSLKRWMPMSFSMYQGGMTPDLSRSPVRFLIERAHGRTSS